MKKGKPGLWKWRRFSHCKVQDTCKPYYCSQMHLEIWILMEIRTKNINTNGNLWSMFHAVFYSHCKFICNFMLLRGTYITLWNNNCKKLQSSCRNKRPKGLALTGDESWFWNILCLCILNFKSKLLFARPSCPQNTKFLQGDTTVVPIIPGHYSHDRRASKTKFLHSGHDGDVIGRPIMLKP
jgi:hypothetical protein